MSLQALSTKRIRRTWEPETKPWNDDALDRPWEEIAEKLHKATIFSLKNVFFFSHATSIQAKSIAALVENGHSAVIEAPTGSGKTLSFLIPIMERTVRMCEEYVEIHQRPPLTRSISGVILSPSTTLAEQTYLVARNLAARFPFNIQFVLCDGLMERPIHVMTRLSKIARGGSLFLVTTPRYLQEMLTSQSSSSSLSSSSILQHLTAEKGKRERSSFNAHQIKTETNKNDVKEQHQKQQRWQEKEHDSTDMCAEETITPLQFGTLTKEQRFFVVVDEADLIFSSSEMRSIISHFINMHCVDAQCQSELSELTRNYDNISCSCNNNGNTRKACKRKFVKKCCSECSSNALDYTVDSIDIKNNNDKSKNKKKSSKKEGKIPYTKEISKKERISTLQEKLLTDFVFVGATVTTSNELMLFAESVCKANASILHRVTSHSNDRINGCANDDAENAIGNSNRTECDYLQLLENRYVLCEANCFLPYLVQLLNMHPSKKHFVFFNNTATLQFVEQLFSKLSGDSRPLLYIKSVYTMHEHLSERVRMMQYNAFLQHSTTRQSNPHKGVKTEKAVHHKSNLHSMLAGERKNQVFTSGWKRDGKPEMGTGAILLCTDVAAFGLDVRDVDYVYHFEPPFSVQSYIHRIGRVGRMGLRGCSVLLLPCILNDKEKVEEHGRDESNTNNIEPSKNMRKAYNTYSANSTRSILKSKHATHSLHAKSITTCHLSTAQQTYLELLSLHSSLEEWVVPPFAPITALIRRVIAQDCQLLRLAKLAAISMCNTTAIYKDNKNVETKNANECDAEKEHSVEVKHSWFSPQLAIQSLLLSE